MPQTIAAIIPAYNAGDWLQLAVSSALEQTHPVTSVIVVDNASTDSSVIDLDRSDPRLTIISLPENLGAPAARNVGWRHALGHSGPGWIQFLDADDALLPQKVATQLAEAAPLGAADIIYSPVLQESCPPPPSPAHLDPPLAAQLSKPNSQMRRRRLPQHIDPSRSLVAQWLRWELGQTGALLWRTEALLTVGGWRESQPCCQDNEITLRALQAALRFRFAPSPGAIYRHWSEDTLSRRDPTRTLRQRAALTLDCLNWLVATAQPLAPLSPVIAEEAYAVARLLAAQGHLDEASTFLTSLRQHLPIVPIGRACPRPYRLVHRLLGFTRTEILARSLRPASRARGAPNPEGQPSA